MLIDFIIGGLAFSFVLFVFVKKILTYKKSGFNSTCCENCESCCKICEKNKS